MDMETSKLTAEGIISEAVRIGAKMSGGEFPIEVFPIRIQRIISSLHDCQGYPVDYVAAAILAAIAVGIGNSHLVQVKRNWLESPILYMALIGRPGANKSHPLSFAFQPFIEHDYCQNQEYQKLYAEYERTMSMSKKERMEAGLDEFPQAPVRKRFLVSDITPEGLSLIHAQNPRGLCLWSDELSAWFKNFNRYNNGSEEQFWLSVFNAKPTISDRKSTQSSIFIRRPYISVIGTIQKKILGELVKGERSSNGFIDRILFVLPKSREVPKWTDWDDGGEDRASMAAARWEQRFYIPERVLDYFNDEFDYREVANSSELTDIAVALFVGMLDTPAVSAGGGGEGSQSDLPWRDKEDDDLQWARRCARAATLLLGKKPRTGLRR